jgi:hypothetical protein
MISYDIVSVFLFHVLNCRFSLSTTPSVKPCPVQNCTVWPLNMPYRTGGPEGWNFGKEHRILPKVRDILLFGWIENFSHQGPEHGHIDNCKCLADCTNNKEVYLTVLRAHSREGHLQYLRSLEADLADAAQEEEGDGAKKSVAASAVDGEGNAGACELGIQYPTLQSIYVGKSNKQSIQVYDIISNII